MYVQYKWLGDYVSQNLSHVCFSADYGTLAHVLGRKRGEVASDLASRLHSFHHLKAWSFPTRNTLEVHKPPDLITSKNKTLLEKDYYYFFFANNLVEVLKIGSVLYHFLLLWIITNWHNSIDWFMLVTSLKVQVLGQRGTLRFSLCLTYIHITTDAWWPRGLWHHKRLDTINSGDSP